MEPRSIGGNYPAITQEKLQSILIPIPLIDKQLEIVEHIDAIRKRAKQLRQEAAADLEKVKQEVEAMILGGNTAEAKTQPRYDPSLNSNSQTGQIIRIDCSFM